MKKKPGREIFFQKRRLGEDDSLESKQHWDSLGDQAKLASGRPQDLVDASMLRKMRDKI